MRDNGGWKTADGRRMRQGLLYRGSELEYASYNDRDPHKDASGHVAITEQGIAVLRDELKIRTDLDLRLGVLGSLKESPLGKTVDFRLIPALPYDEFMTEDQKPIVKQIFELFADRSAYPIYCHCWGGADRTGTIAYLLEAFLGVAIEDIILDYELTSLGIWGKRVRTLEYFVKFEKALAACDPAGSVQSRAEKFLRSCGIGDKTLQALRDIFLEGEEQT